MIYVDELFYKNSYLLGRKPAISAGFDYYARNASQELDRHTFWRLKDSTEVSERVKLCCCELAECLFSQDAQKKASSGKTSEKIGTYSVSFESASSQQTENQKTQRLIICKWLEDTGLLYGGGV